MDLIGHTERCGIEDPGMLEQDAIDFQWSDVHAAANDEVFAAPRNVNEAFTVQERQAAVLIAWAASGRLCRRRANSPSQFAGRRT
jgi:hypothetical protein